MKVKSESGVAQLCLTLSDPMEMSLIGNKGKTLGNKLPSKGKNTIV